MNDGELEENRVLVAVFRGEGRVSCVLRWKMLAGRTYSIDF